METFEYAVQVKGRPCTPEMVVLLNTLFVQIKNRAVAPDVIKRARDLGIEIFHQPRRK